MSAIRHPNVVLFMGVCLDPPCMVTEVRWKICPNWLNTDYLLACLGLMHYFGVLWGGSLVTLAELPPAASHVHLALQHHAALSANTDRPVCNNEVLLHAALQLYALITFYGCVAVQFCARGSMFDVLAKARSSPLLAQQLDWPKRVSMALDAAKVGL